MQGLARYTCITNKRKDQRKRSLKRKMSIVETLLVMIEFRIECFYSFKYGKAGLHVNNYDEVMLCFVLHDLKPLRSDQLVKEILSYFEKGLKYIVPRDLFCYEVVRVTGSGKEVLRRIGFGDSNWTFKYKLFGQLTHVLPNSVGLEEASDGTTYVYCD
jgi:hypothetical protein